MPNLFLDFCHGLKVKHSPDVEQIAITEWSHDTFHSFLLVDQSSSDDVNLLFLQIIGGMSHLEKKWNNFS